MRPRKYHHYLTFYSSSFYPQKSQLILAANGTLTYNIQQAITLFAKDGQEKGKNS
jgi:hypothetical protein